MASVTQRIPNYLGGVSKQSDDKKKPGQVKECINAYPEPTFGLIKRPGFKFIHSLDQTTGGTDFSGTALDNAKWFYINRDDDETYIGCILSGAIHIWNAVSKVKSTVTMQGSSASYLNTTRDNYSIVTVQDTTIVTNKTKVVATTAAPGSTDIGKKATVVISGVDYSSIYEIIITPTHSGASAQTITETTRDGEAFAVDGGGSNEKLSTEDILTDLTTKITAKISSGDLANFTVKGASDKLYTTLELSCNLPFTITARGGPSNKLLTAFQDEVESVSDLPAECVHGRVVKVINTESKDDTYYGEFIAENTTYNSDGTVNVAGSGRGYWEETISPSVSTGLDGDTMPHELVNTATDAFTFRPITWTQRLVGDDTTNEHPSFVTKKIQQPFFHNNRLGFLTGDNVSMSQSGEFYNFYHISATILSASDPVDLSCSSIRPSVLHAVLPTAQGLVLFSEDSQYMMYADDGILTPTTSVIRGIANYEIDKTIHPVDNGTTISFLSKTPGYSRVFSMQTRGNNQNPIILDIGKVVTEWIPDTVTDLTSSPQNDIIAMYGENANDVYFYRTYNDGEKNVVQSWFSWKLPGNVLHMTIDNDTVYTVVKYVDSSSANNRYHLLKTSLTQTPSDAIVITNSGQKLNPYMDMYAAASSVVYNTAGDFSKCYLPYGDITGLTPIVMLKGDVSTSTWGSTQSGFTLSPDSAKDPAWEASTAYAIGDVVSNDSDKVYTCDTAGTSAGSGGPTGTGANITDGGARWDYTRTGSAYFKVPRKNWVSIAADVVVGYKFNYDITLPKTYFQLSETVYDYTSVLTIARMKFSIGLSSVVGFKVKKKGFNTPSWENLGDGSTTAFPFELDYKDVNDLKVKVNGVETTNFTISGSTLTMGSAPTNGHKILLYTDEWYDMQPVQDANYYLADDVPFTNQSIFTLPIHDKTDNFSVRVFSDSPFPASLTSMMWEGNYSPRYYRRI